MAEEQHTRVCKISRPYRLFVIHCRYETDFVMSVINNFADEKAGGHEHELERKGAYERAHSLGNRKERDGCALLSLRLLVEPHGDDAHVGRENGAGLVERIGGLSPCEYLLVDRKLGHKVHLVTRRGGCLRDIDAAVDDKLGLIGPLVEFVHELYTLVIHLVHDNLAQTIGIVAGDGLKIAGDNISHRRALVIGHGQFVQVGLALVGNIEILAIWVHGDVGLIAGLGILCAGVYPVKAVNLVFAGLLIDASGELLELAQEVGLAAREGDLSPAVTGLLQLCEPILDVLGVLAIGILVEEGLIGGGVGLMV